MFNYAIGELVQISFGYQAMLIDVKVVNRVQSPDSYYCDLYTLIDEQGGYYKRQTRHVHKRHMINNAVDAMLLL